MVTRGKRENTLILALLFIAGVNGLWNDLNEMANPEAHRSDVIPLYIMKD